MKTRFSTLFTVLAACCPPGAKTATPITSGNGDGSGTDVGVGEGSGTVGPGEVTPSPSYNEIPRLDFNRRAAELALPLFWRTDADKDGTLDPDELVALWGWEGPSLETFVAGGAFTPAFAKVYASME